MSYVGIENWDSKLIGFGCDGANVNIAAGGLRGHLENAVPWIVVFWCLAHRLELALKNALSATSFPAVDEMLLRLYYLYEKSPKKCAQLNEVVQELRKCLDDCDTPESRGNRPIRACGTRFVAHKVAALGRIIDKYGAYISHLVAMSEDKTVKSADRVKLKAYAQKWRNAKSLLGCAFFYDILKPCSILCKVLQEDEVCVVRAIESLLKTKKNIDKLKETTFDDLPTVNKVIGRIKHTDADTNPTYQEAEITHYEQAVEFFRLHQEEYMEQVQDCLRHRVKVNNIEMVTHSLTILATNGWEKFQDASFGHGGLDNISTRFRLPLEKAGVDCSSLQDEWDDLVDYAKRYLDLVRDDYRVIWWKLFNSADAKKWGNILTVVELLFCLPISNGRVERVFSQLKL